MTDPSATPMGKDEVLALLGRLATFSAVMKAGEIIAMRDSVAALYAERDALRAENEQLRHAAMRMAVNYYEAGKGSGHD